MVRVGAEGGGRMLLWVRGVQVLIAFEGDGGVETKAEAEAEAKATRRARRCSRPIGRQKKITGGIGESNPGPLPP